MPPPAFRYRAFISFAPADNSVAGRKWAGWLREALENFEVPRGLAGRRLPAGIVPDELRPIALSGTADELTDEAREDLEQSPVLIVICSPAAAKSDRVHEEVRHFKKLGRQRVVAFIVAGEPDTEDECFPDTLRHDVRRDGSLDTEWRVHPIAVDGRTPNGSQGHTSADAMREALLKTGKATRDAERAAAAYMERLTEARMKLTAAVLGVPAPELVRQLESPEQGGASPATLPPRRRVGLGIFIFLLLALALAGVAGWFVWQAQEQVADAVAAKRRADTLLAMVQRDLSGRLALEGGLLPMSEANERLAYYFRELAKSGEAAASTALADTLSTGADIAMERGLYPSAVELAMEAAKTREPLVTAGESSAEATVRLIADERKAAVAMLKAGRKTESSRQADIARKRADEALKRHGDDETVAEEFVRVCYVQAEARMAAGRNPEAQEALTSGLAVAAKIAAVSKDPGAAQGTLVTGETAMGDLRMQMRDPASAILRYRAAEKILESMVQADSQNGALQRQHGELVSKIAHAFFVQSEWKNAADEYRREAGIWVGILKSGRGTDPIRWEYCAALRDLARSLLATGAEGKPEAAILLQQAADALQGDAKNPDPRIAPLRLEIERLKADAK